MTLLDFLPLLALLALVAASVVQRLASRAVQPARLLLAQKGEAFIARADAPASLKAEVQRTIECPFSCNCVFLFLLLPVLPLLVWLDLGRGKNATRFSEMKQSGHEVRGAYLEIRALSRKIQLANHPILSPVGELVVSLSIVLALPFLLSSRRFSEGALDRDNAVAGVDEYWSHLPRFREAV